jgi:hypothetical protein
VAPGASLAIGASGNPNRITLTGGHVLRIEEGATGVWGPINTDFVVEAPSSIVNAGTLTISNDTQITGSGTLVNSGTLVKASHLQTTIGAPFDNDGLVEVAAGVLEVSGEGLDNTGTVRIGASSIARMASYRQTDTGTLEVAIAGVSPALRYGQLVASGAVSLTGKLSLVTEPGAEVASGTDLLIMTAGDLDGGFSEVLLPPTIIGVGVRYADEGVVVHVN